MTDLANVSEVLERYGRAEYPTILSVVSRADQRALIDKPQASVDEVLDTKQFWR